MLHIRQHCIYLAVSRLKNRDEERVVVQLNVGLCALDGLEAGDERGLEGGGRVDSLPPVNRKPLNCFVEYVAVGKSEREC